MGKEPQTFEAPDGTKMVVLPQADYERLVDLADETEDIRVAGEIMSRIEAGEGTVPGEVVSNIFVDGLHPIAAWRKYRDLSQAELARKASLSQVWVSRIESGSGHGTPKTRKKIAEALDAPLWALDNDEEEDIMKPSFGRGKGRKYLPLQDFLRANSKSRVTLGFDKIADLVGGLPRSASVYSAWWANHKGNSQAVGWMGAGYKVEVDQKQQVATFTTD